MVWLKRLGWLVGVLLGALILTALVTALWYRNASLPRTSGPLAVTGLQGKVDVVRDAEGIPHLYADNADDIYFALGFVHAQDRLWQLEMNRRIESGRMAEVLGPAALDTDKFLRTLGVRRNAEAIYAHLDPATRHGLDRYAAGINAWLDRHDVLPIEFLLTGAPFPEHWSPVDSIAWSTMMAWDLSGNWSTELMRMRLAQRLSLKQINELLPPYPGDPVLPTADYTVLYRQLKDVAAKLALDFTAAPPGLVEGMGSNNWVVSGVQSVTGKPLLANDPHLGLSAPALWYFAHLSAPGLNSIGATLPGLPLVVLGRNDRIAWGFTNTGPDTQDLYVEEIRDGKARTPGGWADLKTRAETFHVKGQADVVIQVQESRHGPIISNLVRPARAALKGVGDDRYAIAFAWSALSPDDKTVRGGFALNRAANWDDFVAAARDYGAPQQNMVYADVDGNIGFLAPGRVPVRKPDNDLKGQAPAPGWDARYDWDGWIPFDDLPRRSNPPEGRVVTANNKIVASDYRPFLTSEWTPPYRAQRIEALLAATPKQSMESFAAIQADVRSLAAVELLPTLLETVPSSPAARAALDKLKTWDGTMAADRAEPAIYNAWMRELTRLVYADELGPELFADYWDQRQVFMGNVLRNVDGQGRWCDDVSTPAVETCAQRQTRALDLALADLARRLGPDVDQWRWSALHYARSEHRPFARVDALARVFDIREPTGGDTYTVNVGRHLIRSDTEPFVNKHAASLRALYDLSDLENSRFMHSTGQSGNRLSPLYANFADRWARVDYVPMHTRRAAVEQGAIGTLTLTPP